MGFHELQFAVDAHRVVEHHKQRITKGFQLWAVVLFECVGDGQFVQMKLLLQAMQGRRIGLLQADPDEMLGLCGPAAAFDQLNIGHFFAFGVHRGGHDLSHAVNSLLQLADRSLCPAYPMICSAFQCVRADRPPLQPLA